MTDDATAAYAKLLREAADTFVMTAAVVAERGGLAPAAVVENALADAVSRLTENGTLGTATFDD